jgi:hypothetical protein
VCVARRIRASLIAWLIQRSKHENVDYVPVVKKVLNQKQGWINAALDWILGQTEEA